MPLEHQDRDVESDAATRPDEVEAGLRTLERYLSRHAAFDRWCSEHLRRYGRAPGESSDPG